MSKVKDETLLNKKNSLYLYWFYGFVKSYMLGHHIYYWTSFSAWQISSHIIHFFRNSLFSIAWPNCRAGFATKSFAHIEGMDVLLLRISSFGESA